MSELLVSFCYTRPLGHAIARIDTHSDAFEWVDLSSVPVPVYGATGLVRVGTRYYAALQVKFEEAFGTQLIEMDDHARVLRSAPLPYIVDAHSMIESNGELLVVGTGTNQVFALSWPDGEAPSSRVFYEQEPGADTLHMNSLQAFDGRIYLSMFGKRLGTEWHQADDGQVLDLTAGGAIVARGFRHPHALFAIDDALMCLESRAGAVAQVGGCPRAPFARLPGYLRGACTADGTLYVGASMARRRSKSGSIANARATLGLRSNTPNEPCRAPPLSSAAIDGDGCGLHVIDMPDDAHAAVDPHGAASPGCSPRWIDLSPFAPELYDLIPWHGAPVRGSRADAMMQRLRAVNGEFTDLASVWRRMLLQRLQMREIVREIDAARCDLPAVQRIVALAREIEQLW